MKCEFWYPDYDYMKNERPEDREDVEKYIDRVMVQGIKDCPDCIWGEGKICYRKEAIAEGWIDWDLDPLLFDQLPIRQLE